jgi:large subunit ribosomal protein L25
MDKLKLEAQKRSVLGRKVKSLRGEGLIPANVYGKKVKSQAVSVNASEFLSVYKEAGETGLISLVLKNGKAEEKAVLVSNVQQDPVKDTPIHVDFHQVDLKEKVTAQVSVDITGESPAEKQGVGTIVQYIDEVEVEALPADLPEEFVVDVSSLEEVGAAIFVKDLRVDKTKAKILSDPESIVVKVEPPQKEEEVAPPPVEEVVAEGEAPAGAEIPEGEEKAEEATTQEEPKAEE